MRSDQSIRRDVELALEWEPSIDASEIGVSVNDGTVALSGYVHEYLHRWTAEKVAKRIVGVLALANDIEVRPTAGGQRTDAQIAHAAVEALKNTSSIPEGKVRPIVRNNILTLEGEVEWQYQREAAERVVRGLRGLKGVTNTIAVKPKRQASASEIRVKIEDALKRSARLDARKIAIMTCNGTVTLSGHVRSDWEREEAEMAAWAAPGVVRVDNRLTIAAPVQEDLDYDQ